MTLCIAGSEYPRSGRLGEELDIFPNILIEARCRAAQRSLDTISDRLTATVEHLAEQIGQCFDHTPRLTIPDQSRFKFSDTDRLEVNLPVQVLAEAGGDIGKADQLGPGNFIHLPTVPVVGQRRDSNLSDIVDIDERLGNICDRQRDIPIQDELAEQALTEVLVEPGGANDRPADT